LASIYAEPGVHLALSGRNQERLDAVTAECRTAGAEVTAAKLDVRDREKISTWIRSVDDIHPIDLVIASAGITTGLGFGRLREDPEAVRAINAINWLGTLNTVDPVIERMSARGRGQIAFLGSIAALRGLPYSPAYCATKAAVHAYADALRPALAAQGVKVSLIIPGFVETAMNRDIHAPKPLQISATRAAAIIRRGLDRGTAVVAFPWFLYAGARLMPFLPNRLVDFVLRFAHVDIPETNERNTK
jgi:short-subunit dehydrogenase